MKITIGKDADGDIVCTREGTNEEILLADLPTELGCVVKEWEFPSKYPVWELEVDGGEIKDEYVPATLCASKWIVGSGWSYENSAVDDFYITPEMTKEDIIAAAKDYASDNGLDNGEVEDTEWSVIIYSPFTNRKKKIVSFWESDLREELLGDEDEDE